MLSIYHLGKEKKAVLTDRKLILCEFFLCVFNFHDKITDFRVYVIFLSMYMHGCKGRDVRDVS